MDLTTSNLQLFFTGLRTAYADGYQQTSPWADKISSELSSGSELETYGWMDLVSDFREWIGERQITPVSIRSRSVVNKTWEETHSIPREKLEDDKAGLFSLLSRQMGENAAKLHDRQLAALILANPTGFDGVSFFSASHPTDLDEPSSSTQSNSFSLALNATNYAAVRASMGSFVGRKGQIIGSPGNLLVVPPQLEYTARTILQASTIPNAGGTASQANVLAGSADLLVIEELASDPTAWYLLNTRKVLKPFMRQIRRPMQFVALMDPRDPNVFFKKEFIFGADCRSAYDVTLWFLACKSKP